MNDITDLGNFASEYVSFYKADYFTTSSESNLPDATMPGFRSLMSDKKQSLFARAAFRSRMCSIILLG